MTPIQSAVIELATQFPNASNHSLGRMAYKKWPELFSSAEIARERFRRARIQRTRKGKGTEAAYLPPTKHTVKSWDAIPEGRTEFVQWEAVNLNVKRPLILSDIHIPFHSKQPLVAALDYGIANNCDSIILNGDTHDFFSISFWEKDPRKRKFAEELKTGRDFLATLRARFGKQRIIFKLGNHEERWERFMRVRAPELLGVEDFEMVKLLRLEELGIEIISDKRPMRVGDLNVIHGHEYRFAIGNPVNPARGLFLRCKAYAMCGHFHQSSYHQDKTIEQKVIATWSTGCLCDFHPEYMPLNNWCHGFAFVEVSDDGKFNVQNKIVRHGKIY